MKNILFIVLLSWVYVLVGKSVNTLEHWNQPNKYNFSKEEKSQPPWSKHSRHKRSSQECPEGQFHDEIVDRCCRLCPAGQYVNTPCAASGQDPICAVCEENAYLESSNYKIYCMPCTICDHEKQFEFVPCTPKHNRECRCKEEFYEKKGACFPCTRCPNRDIKTNCSNITNAVCGDCLPDFFEENNECQPCNQSNKGCTEVPAACKPMCVPLIPPTSHNYVMFGIVPLLLVSVLVGLFIFKYKWKKEHSLGGEVYPMCEEEVATIPPNTCPEESILITFEESPVSDLCSVSNSQGAGHVPSVLQKGCALYDIIDCIPVKRWKELMRNLQLPDNEIERVEMEVCNFRDQQYEMLRRWCQLKTASMEAIYQALDRMQLSRCLEELKAKIEQYS